MMMARMFAGAGALGLLSLVSCGDSVSPSGQAVVSMHLNQLPASTTPVLNCAPGPHWASVPETATGGQRVSATFAFDRAVDGDSGMQVKCKVAPSGDKFVISATLSSPPAANGGTFSTNIVLSTTIGVDEVGAKGSVSLFDDKTQVNYTSDNCTFSVKPGAGESLQVAPGKVWGSFECSKFADPGTIGNGCRVDTGFFVLENCEG